MTEVIIGNRFWQIDPHIHTPASKDYKEPDASPIDIVKASLDIGLEAIAITDHNNIAWVESVRKSGEELGLIVFPGFELNASGGHVLAIFNPNEDIEVIETALIECGIKKKDFGNQDALGKDIKDVFEVIHNNGGIAIAAHVDGPKGFMTVIDQGQARMAIFNHENLSAIELLNLGESKAFIEGKNAEYERRMACVQGSDAHAIGEIGKRRTIVRMHHPNIEGLSHALDEPQLRIKFPEDWEQAIYPNIRKISVSQGFLAGETIYFNENLNCLVGGAGSGKSTVIELIRFALNQVSTMSDYYDDCMGKVYELAGIGAIVDVELISNDGEVLRVRREVDGAANPIEISKVSDNTQLENVDIAQLFTIHAYSQGEAIDISRSPLHQLELIDKHIEIRDLKLELEQTRKELNSQVEGIVRLETKIKDRESIVSDIATTNEQIASLTRQLEKLKSDKESDIASTHHLWEREKDTLSVLIKSFEELDKQAGYAFDELPLQPLSIPIPEGESPNRKQIEEIFDISKRLESIRSKSKKDFLLKCKELLEEINEVGANWKEKYLQHLKEYQSLKFEEGEERIKALSAELIKAQRRKQAKEGRLTGISAAEDTLKSLLDKRVSLLKKMSDLRARIYETRRVKAKEFISKIGDKISLKVINNGNRISYRNALDDLIRGTRASGEVKDKIVESLLPIQLAELIMEENVKELSQRAGIGEKWAETIIHHRQASPEFLYLVESIDIQDYVKIGFQVEPGKYKSINKLSTGQKATVIVLLSMVEGDKPIVFDQPEDALYTPFIYSEVVKILKQEKDSRQFIFATHNANISIASDLDLGIIMEANANKATIEAAGGLDDAETRSLMVLHLEGGEEAFTTRGKKLRLIE